MKKFILTLVIFFSSLSIVMAQPAAVVKAKDFHGQEVIDKIEVGQVIWLDTEGSAGKTFEWHVFPESAQVNFRDRVVVVNQDDDEDETTPPVLVTKHEAAFLVPEKGTYYFLFIATEGDISAKAPLALSTEQGPGPNPNPNPDPVIKLPDIPEPPAHLKELVKDIPGKLVGDDVQEDAVELVLFYWDMADTLQRDSDSKIVTTTGKIRELNIRAGALMFQKTGIKGKYSGLGSSIDSVLVEVLGLADVSLTESKRGDAVKAFSAIAWSCKSVIEEK